MKMKLKIPERLSLLGILPKEGDILMLRIINDLQTSLGFSEEELKKFKVKYTVSGERMRVKWDEKIVDEGKEIDIGPAARTLIIDTLKRLSDQKKLSLNMLPLYEKFVEKPEEKPAEKT